MESTTKFEAAVALSGYSASVSQKSEKPVCYAFIKFEHLMYETGLFPHKAQNFSTKIEIDTNPPQGAVVTSSIVNIYFALSFLSYDTPSLFAGKLHGLLNRKYTKGRDFYDLGWYLSRWKTITPNIALLRNALKQTGWKKELPEEGTWRTIISAWLKKQTGRR